MPSKLRDLVTHREIQCLDSCQIFFGIHRNNTLFSREEVLLLVVHVVLVLSLNIDFPLLIGPDTMQANGCCMLVLMIANDDKRTFTRSFIHKVA